MTVTPVTLYPVTLKAVTPNSVTQNPVYEPPLPLVHTFSVKQAVRDTATEWAWTLLVLLFFIVLWQTTRFLPG